VSRVRHEKGIDVLLDAMPGERLLVVGDGPDRAALERRAPANVVWAGQQPWERAIALMKGMDIVVVPSRFEGFGLAAAEAMAAGKAVVASDVDGLREVVGDAGVLVPAGDAVALGAALRRLLADPAERAALGRKARERVEQCFVPEMFRQKILALYGEALA
jgi:glycosyltransferase involved in cell wall biosynthesis